MTWLLNMIQDFHVGTIFYPYRPVEGRTYLLMDDRLAN